jgi:benzoyl-CoA reductase/2-hydroxyglutaryl-CoA dehydratase subunit BcrC/BadD/HgdB
MSNRCNKPDSEDSNPTLACAPDASPTPFAWFENMIGNNLAYARKAHAEGQPVVGIMCEYTPREVIMAAGAISVCLCGGSAATIPAAEAHLPSNLCPLIKSTFGYHILGSNPFLEMASLIVAETTCDGKKKMFELMGASRDLFVLELPQKCDDCVALEHWYNEVLMLKKRLEEKFSVTITREGLADAIRLMNRERDLRRTLARFMTAPCPPMSGRQLLKFKSSISGVPADLEQYQKAIRILAKSDGAPELARRARVLLTGVPMAHGAERVAELIEWHGGLVVCMENCTGLKPILEDVSEDSGDPLRAIAEKYFHLPCSVMTRNDRRLEWLRKLAAEYRADCVIDLTWQACLTYDVESYWVRKLATEELGIPYLHIQTDYSPSDTARLAVRLEALFETVRGRGSR